MCLISSYTELEKTVQASKVLNMMAVPPTTETDLKNFLYNLSFMNDMVVKGYKKERTEADSVIYAVKTYACRWLIENFYDRCIEFYNILYVYSSGRQYSYHLRSLNFYYEHTDEWGVDRIGSLDADAVKVNHRYVRWNGVEGSWKLSDEEYKQRTRQEDKPIVPHTQTAMFKARLEKYKKEKSVRLRFQLEKERMNFFFAELAKRMPKVSKNKCVINKNYEECCERYAEKSGLVEYKSWSFRHGYNQQD